MIAQSLYDVLLTLFLFHKVNYNHVPQLIEFQLIKSDHVFTRVANGFLFQLMHSRLRSIIGSLNSSYDKRSSTARSLSFILPEKDQIGTGGRSDGWKACKFGLRRGVVVVTKGEVPVLTFLSHGLGQRVQSLYERVARSPREIGLVYVCV